MRKKKPTMEKMTSSIIKIKSAEGRVYTLNINTKTDAIGLSRTVKAGNKKSRCMSFVKISSLIENVEEQVREVKNGS